MTIRAKECHLALNLLEKLNRGELDEIAQPFDEKKELELKSFSERLDFEDGSILSGHSFGGGTVVKALAENDRFKAAFCFDSWLFPIRNEIENLSKKIVEEEKNLFFLNYEKFQWKKNLVDMTPFERSLGSNFPSSNVATVKKAIHYSSTDLPTIFSGSNIKYVLNVLEWLSSRNSSGDESEVLKPEQVLTLSQKLFLNYISVIREEKGKENEFKQAFNVINEHIIWKTHYMD